jgi:hypothetical protein
VYRTQSENFFKRRKKEEGEKIKNRDFGVDNGEDLTDTDTDTDTDIPTLLFTEGIT